MMAASEHYIPRQKEARMRRVAARAWADIIVLSFLSMLGIIGFETSFGGNGYLVAGIGGLLVGVSVGVASFIFRLGALWTTFAAIAAYFLFGSAIAVPGETMFGFVPTLQSLQSLIEGAVFGWADILTLKTPVGAPEYIAGVPYVTAWLVGLVFTVLVTRWIPFRPRAAWRAAMALIGPLCLYVVGILTGTEDAYLAGIRGVSFAVVALVWLGWRQGSGSNSVKAAGNSLLRRKIFGTLMVVGASVVIGAVVGTLVAPSAFARFVLRDEIQPPFDPLDYASPLAGFRHFTKDVPDDILFTVSGLQPGEVVRIATMDSYTGKLWNVAGPELATEGSGAFNLVGPEIPAPPLATMDGTRTITIKIEGYSDVWLPTVGYAKSIVFASDAKNRSESLRYNISTGAAVLTSGVREGVVYTITTQLQKIPTADELSALAPASFQLPPVNNVPDIVNAKAEEYAGEASSPYEKLSAIATALTKEGYLSHGLKSDAVPSQAGHGADRMNMLFTRIPMVGDEEQYASAFALMARHYGYPARVVMGFAPEIADGSSTVSVKGSDITAWVEVAFEGVGWVPFSPTPTQTDAPEQQVTTAKSEPLPQVRQPPRTTQDQNNLLSPVAIDGDDNKDDPKAAFEIPGWAYVLAGVVGIPLLAYFVPLIIIGLLKKRRRTRRRTKGDGAVRTAGAWDELTDIYSELGYSLDRKHSRLQVAADIQEQFAEQLGRRERERAAAIAAKAARTVDRTSRTGSPEGEVESETAVSSSASGVFRGLTAWIPVSVKASEELPGMPELFGVASSIDEAVFAGHEVSEGVVNAAWGAASDSEKSARGSVSWFQRELSKFRIRTQRDWLAALTKAGGVAMPSKVKESARA